MNNANVNNDLISLRHSMRHSAAHLLADAVLNLFPEAKLAIGPPTDEGFYYDFEVNRPFTPEDIVSISNYMDQIIVNDFPFEYKTLTRDQALTMFSKQPFKLEILQEIESDEIVSIYSHGSFVDLCRGPHVNSTGEISAFKLLNIAGAYWRGDERRPMLQRIYGTAFETKEALNEYLLNLEEAQKRDHRKLSRELDLLSFHEQYGPGLVYWHPKGGRIRTIIEDFWRKEHFRAGYDIVYSPHIGRASLWETSGHLNFYAENMYSPMDVDGQDYYVKPMNCPFHIQIYKSSLRSYRELPIKLAELGTVYRYERSGVLHGLFRVRGFTQDDAHIFCTTEQVRNEIESCVDFMQFFLKAFGFQEFRVYLSTRDKSGKFAGSLEDWDMATQVLRNVIKDKGLPYVEDEGGAVFYGPKIDVKMVDALGREWQCTTIQFDFNLPDRFNVSYIGEDGKEHRPYMVHRALLGSIERFFGVLVEQYAGAFPTWLAPTQAMVIPIADRHLEYATLISRALIDNDLRVSVDNRPDRMNAKIRDAQLNKIPYMLIVGDDEIASDSVALRTRSGENMGKKTLEETRLVIQQAIDSMT